MIINYNITGEKRKSLVVAISQELDAKVKYLGAPTFAYEVGEYHIDKNGLLEGEDNVGLVADLCGLHGFKAVTEDYNDPMTYEDSLGGVSVLEIIDNLEIAEKEELGLGEHYSDHRGEDGIQSSDVQEPEKTNSLTIEMPLEGFTAATLENLDRLIGSKASLIKKAVGAESLPVIRTENTLKFQWFSVNATSDEVSAYSRFIGALCAAAKEQKRVTAKDKPVDNDKFAFRVFLVRLGFVGDDYKEARKILLGSLSGNSAFKGGAPSEKEVSIDE